MHSFLQETLVPLADGVVCVTCDRRPSHDEPARDTRLAYARFESERLGTVDLMPALSKELLPSSDSAAKRRADAKGQREVAKHQSGEKSRARYEQEAAKYEWEASESLKFSREMPDSIVALDDWRVAVSFRGDRPNMTLRVVDVQSGAIEFECRGPDLDGLFGGVRHFRRPPEEAALLDAVRDDLASMGAIIPPSAGSLPSRVKLIAGGGGRLLLSNVGQQGFVVVSYVEGGLRPYRALGIAHLNYSPALLHGDLAIVCAADAPGKAPRLFIIDLVGDRIVGTLPLDHEDIPHCIELAARANLVWVAHGRGYVDRVDLASISSKRIQLVKGLGPYEWLDISVSSDGSHLLARVSAQDATPLYLLDSDAMVLKRHSMPAVETCRVGDQPDVRSRLRRTMGFGFVRDQPEVLIAGQRSPLGFRPVVEELTGIAETMNAGVAPRLARSLSGGPLAAQTAALAKCASNGLQIIATRLLNDSAPAGHSKFGGMPDLGLDAQWPRYKGRPMMFLAQVNLEEIAAACPDSLLPKSGLLSFFRAMDPDDYIPLWYDEESDRLASRVLYSPDAHDNERSTLPLHRASRERAFLANPCSLRFATAPLLPSFNSLRFLEMGLTDEEREAYLNLGPDLAPTYAETAAAHQILGFLRPTQDWHEVHAQKILQGEDQYGGFDVDSDEGRRLVREAGRWIPLLHLVRCEQAGWDWCDGGSLLWMIRDDDLQNLKFDRAVALSVR